MTVDRPDKSKPSILSEDVDLSPDGAERDLNRRETGARFRKEMPQSVRPNPVHTGDKGDEPKKPYGLTESIDDVNEKTRHSDGQNPPGITDTSEK